MRPGFFFAAAQRPVDPADDLTLRRRARRSCRRDVLARRQRPRQRLSDRRSRQRRPDGRSPLLHERVFFTVEGLPRSQLRLRFSDPRNAPAPVGIRGRRRRSPFADGETKKRLSSEARGASTSLRYDETRRPQRNGGVRRVAALIPTRRARNSFLAFQAAADRPGGARTTAAAPVSRTAAAPKGRLRVAGSTRRASREERLLPLPRNRMGRELFSGAVRASRGSRGVEHRLDEQRP